MVKLLRRMSLKCLYLKDLETVNEDLTKIFCHPATETIKVVINGSF